MSIDASKPCIGRIYDYVLGGHNNFDVDRQEAEKILKLLPNYPFLARLNRWFLQLIAERWAQEGVTQVLDFGSGMPTQGHFHTCMPRATILYSDNDPMTIAYAQQVLADTPQAHYVLMDIRDIDLLLSTASTLLAPHEPTAIGFIGVSYFIEDAFIRRIAQATYEWASPGSQMALSFLENIKEDGVTYSDAKERLRGLGAETYSRSAEQIRELFAPWQVTELKRLEAWLGLENSFNEHTQGQANEAAIYGALLARGE